MDKRPFFSTLTIVALTVACGTTEQPSAPANPVTETPFDVSVTVTASLAAISGCLVKWKAKANKRLIEVSYSVWANDSRNLAEGGTFRDSVLVVWNQAIDRSFTVNWVVSAGTWGKEGSVGVSC